MKISLDEVVERGLSITEEGRVLDEYGNEYRDENGEFCWVELNE